MEYSSIFVCLMGMGTVFFGLICLILLTMLMGRICLRTPQSVCTEPASVSAPVPAAESDQNQLLAAISAAIAEDLGTDINGIRILSVKKL